MLFEKIDLSFLTSIVDPWYSSLSDPENAQKSVLIKLFKNYQKTRYGQQCSANDVTNILEFRKSFPIIDYSFLNPYLKSVMEGDFNSILPEPPVNWVMTRGSTGPAKVLPATITHLEQIFSCGARALINYLLRTKDFGILTGNILNLNLPSVVHETTSDGQTTNYGYSSGTYAKLNPSFKKISLLPRQEEIDSLGPGITKSDWKRRFDLVYEQAKNENVVAAMGVTPVILSFAKHIEKKYGKKPKELWKTHALFCTSVRKIQFKYAPILRGYFGQVPVVEMYSATEGVFAQQIDDLPFITPNYDTYFFEVRTSKGMRMLHELKRGEWGELIVSSCMFPRYAIGDMVEAAGKNYFRIFGRRNALTLLEHRLYNLFFGSFI